MTIQRSSTLTAFSTQSCNPYKQCTQTAGVTTEAGMFFLASRWKAHLENTRLRVWLWDSFPGSKNIYGCPIPSPPIFIFLGPFEDLPLRSSVTTAPIPRPPVYTLNSRPTKVQTLNVPPETSAARQSLATPAKTWLQSDCKVPPIDTLLEAVCKAVSRRIMWLQEELSSDVHLHLAKIDTTVHQWIQLWLTFLAQTTDCIMSLIIQWWCPLKRYHTTARRQMSSLHLIIQSFKV